MTSQFSGEYGARSMPVEPRNDATPTHDGTLVLKRRERAIRAARRHTIVVRTLRVVLPLASLGLLSFYVLFADLRVTIGQNTLQARNVAISQDKLTITRPRLNGATADGATYIVNARAAKQSLKERNIVDLDAIEAVLRRPDGDWVEMKAKTGRFFQSQERLHLSGGIRVVRKDGSRARLASADIYIPNEKLVSKEPVTVEMLNGTVRARSMELELRSRRVRFAGAVRVRLRKRTQRASSQGASSATPAGPPPSAGPDAALQSRPPRRLPR